MSAWDDAEAVIRRRTGWQRARWTGRTWKRESDPGWSKLDAFLANGVPQGKSSDWCWFGPCPIHREGADGPIGSCRAAPGHTQPVVIHCDPCQRAGRGESRTNLGPAAFHRHLDKLLSLT